MLVLFAVFLILDDLDPALVNPILANKRFQTLFHAHANPDNVVTKWVDTRIAQL